LLFWLKTKAMLLNSLTINQEHKHLNLKLHNNNNLLNKMSKLNKYNKEEKNNNNKLNKSINVILLNFIVLKQKTNN
jgi:hypothetical protein